MARMPNWQRHWPLLCLLVVTTASAGQWLWRSPAPVRPAIGQVLSCTLISVHDGDTLSARCRGHEWRIRLQGIDAPELGQAPWGERARAALYARLDVSLLLYVHAHDRYGRIVGQVKSRGRDPCLELLRLGYVAVYQRYNRDSEYRQAERSARQQRLGIWAAAGAQQQPERWRRLNP